jgi:hypothetical protein
VAEVCQPVGGAINRIDPNFLLAFARYLPLPFRKAYTLCFLTAVANIEPLFVRASDQVQRLRGASSGLPIAILGTGVL